MPPFPFPLPLPLFLLVTSLTDFTNVELTTTVLVTALVAAEVTLSLLPLTMLIDVGCEVVVEATETGVVLIDMGSVALALVA